MILAANQLNQYNLTIMLKIIKKKSLKIFKEPTGRNIHETAIGSKSFNRIFLHILTTINFL